jgi:hypothetical protein
VKLDHLTMRVVANFFILIVCPLLTLAAYRLGYSDGKMTGYVDGFLAHAEPDHAVATRRKSLLGVSKPTAPAKEK